MKGLVLLLCAIASVAGFAAQQPQFAEIHSVYLLRMTNGLDQFLANRLAGEKLFRVVTDPQLAEALFTDRLGESFELKYAELYPPPKPEKPEPAKPEGEAKETAKEEPSAAGKLAIPEEARVRLSTFGRGKGTIFLVDRKTRAVLWSTYQKPKNSTAEELDRTARRIIDRLKEDLKRK